MISFAVIFQADTSQEEQSTCSEIIYFGDQEDKGNLLTAEVNIQAWKVLYRTASSFLIDFKAESLDLAKLEGER